MGSFIKKIKLILKIETFFQVAKILTFFAIVGNFIVDLNRAITLLAEVTGV